MDAAAIVALSVGLGAPVITYLANPWVQARLKRQQENDPTQGWRTAVDELKRTVVAQGVELGELRAEVTQLEADLRTSRDLTARQDRIIEDQGQMIRAYSSRTTQLEVALAGAGRPVPPMDPAVAYWLARPAPPTRNA